MLYAGIDLGTSSVKLLLCDRDGNVLKSTVREYDIFFPCEGYSEQNPEDWFDKTIDGLKELIEGREQEIGAIGIAGQMHGLVMLDEEDTVIRPAILWNDSRSVRECDYLNNVIGKERLSELTANIAFPGFTAPKIMWVRDNEGENFARCRKIMLPKDYLVYRLTGQFVTEPSDASGLLVYDVKNKCYSKEMLEICSIDESMLPKVYPSYENIGVIKAEIAESLKIGKVIVCPGGGDNACAAVGMGVVGNDMCSVSLGTSGTVFMTRNEFSVDPGNALHSFVHADMNYHLMGCILSAASCNKWWIEEILGSKDYKEFENTPLTGENKVFYLPYMMGERSPHNDPYARGAFVGMSMDTERCDMALAVMEGVSFALRDCVEVARSMGLRLDEVRVCGGGAKSALWCRILANILRVKVIKPVCEEGPAFGAAILAMVATGEYESVKAATEKTVKMGETVQFDESLAEKYDKGYERFKKLYRSLKDWFVDEK